MRERLHADAVEMEGAAVAQICWQQNVPCLIIRCLSDSAEENAEQEMELFLKIAANNSTLKFYILNLIIKTINIDYLHSSDDLSTKELLAMLKEDVSSILDAGYESNQQQTLLYLMEAELASRERSSTRERKLDIFEAKVEELEREAKVKEKEIKKIEKITEQ